MATQLYLGDMTIDVELKNIKNVHLSVYPPSGRVRISAPSRMNLDTIRAFAITKLDWIKKQQRKLQEQERETPREYLDRESHYVFGRRYLLEVIVENAAPQVELKHNKMILRVRSGTTEQGRQAVLDRSYRRALRLAVGPLITTWESLMGVTVQRLYVQRMKTRWGTCNHARHTIRLNTELAKKPLDCLEYVVVHEMVHILEPSHNPRFIALMDQFMPDWQQRRQQLNQLPIRRERWTY